jgi:hypothetical protein
MSLVGPSCQMSFLTIRREKWFIFPILFSAGLMHPILLPSFPFANTFPHEQKYFR